jgi:hypothetical protein
LHGISINQSAGLFAFLMNRVGDCASVLFGGVTILGNIRFYVAAAILHGIARIRNILIYAVKSLRDCTKSSTQISLDIAKAVEECGVVCVKPVAETLLDPTYTILNLLEVHILSEVCTS